MGKKQANKQISWQKIYSARSERSQMSAIHLITEPVYSALCGDGRLNLHSTSKNAFTAPKMHTVTICEILFEKYSFTKMVCLYLWTVSPLKIKMRNFIRNLKSRMKAI